jgi:hypothetical protein
MAREVRPADPTVTALFEWVAEGAVPEVEAEVDCEPLPVPDEAEESPVLLLPAALDEVVVAKTAAKFGTAVTVSVEIAWPFSAATQVASWSAPTWQSKPKVALDDGPKSSCPRSCISLGLTTYVAGAHVGLVGAGGYENEDIPVIDLSSASVPVGTTSWNVVVLSAAPSSDIEIVPTLPSAPGGKKTEVVVASTSAPRFSDYFIVLGLTHVVHQR